MRTRAFGRTGLTVSELGMGCSGLAGGLYYRNDREALATLQGAFDAGITFYDTSSNYGLGRSERLLGRAFAKRRRQVILATKGGARFLPLGVIGLRAKPFLRPIRRLLHPMRRELHHWRDAQKRYDYRPGFLTQSIEASLKRLRTDYLDLFQLYNPSPEAIAEGGIFETLEGLRAHGKVLHTGVSCVTVEDALRCLDHPVIESVQVEINMLDQSALDRLLPEAARHGVAVVARVPLAQGLLTAMPDGSIAERTAQDSSAYARRRQLAERYRAFVTPGRTLAQAALQFVLALPGVSVVIPGMARRVHLTENLNALRAPALTAEEMSQARRLAAGA